ncbi:MAG: DUF308 domain-containing protein [Bacteroidaceae bacterium]
MKTINDSVLRSTVALVIGVLFIMWPEAIREYLVITVGILFFVPGLISLISYFVSKKKEGKRSSILPIVGAGSLLFGLLLIAMPDVFINLLVGMLGFILALGGIQQMFTLFSARRFTKVALGFYVMPVLILALGILILMNPAFLANSLMVILGISSIIYGATELYNGVRFKQQIQEIEEDKEDTSL